MSSISLEVWQNVLLQLSQFTKQDQIQFQIKDVIFISERTHEKMKRSREEENLIEIALFTDISSCLEEEESEGV